MDNEGLDLVASFFNNKSWTLQDFAYYFDKYLDSDVQINMLARLLSVSDIKVTDILREVKYLE